MKSSRQSFFVVLTYCLIIITISIVLLPWKSEIYADQVSELIFQGADYHYKGILEKAIAKFESAVQLDPKNEYAHNQLGILYAKKESYEKAFHEFTIVTELDDQNTFALLWTGILFLQKNDLDQAFDRFNKIIQIDPNNADAYYFSGAIYNFRHNPKMAIKYLKKAKDADSDEADTHFRLAKAYHNVDMIANAMLEYNKALKLKPSYTKALNEIGWIYYNQGDADQAVSKWKEVLKINNRDRDAVLNIAKVYNDLAWKAFQSGNKPEAISFWGKTIKFNPGNKAASFYLKKYASN